MADIGTLPSEVGTTSSPHSVTIGTLPSPDRYVVHPPRLSSLPPELRCLLFQNITDVHTLNNLIKAYPELQPELWQCVTKLTGPMTITHLYTFQTSDPRTKTALREIDDLTITELSNLVTVASIPGVSRYNLTLSRRQRKYPELLLNFLCAYVGANDIIDPEPVFLLNGNLIDQENGIFALNLSSHPIDDEYVKAEIANQIFELFDIGHVIVRTLYGKLSLEGNFLWSASLLAGDNYYLDLTLANLIASSYRVSLIFAQTFPPKETCNILSNIASATTRLNDRRVAINHMIELILPIRGTDIEFFLTTCTGLTKIGLFLDTTFLTEEIALIENLLDTWQNIQTLVIFCCSMEDQAVLSERLGSSRVIYVVGGTYPSNIPVAEAMYRRMNYKFSNEL